MGIGSVIKNTSLTTLLIKAGGIVGVGAVLVDAHSSARVHGDMSEKRGKTDSLTASYLNNQRADSPSVIKDGLKKRMFRFEADENVSGIFSQIKGYVSGFASMVVDDIIPLGLSLGAVVCPKGLASKGFGIGLLAYGGLFVAQEFFGFGKRHS